MMQTLIFFVIASVAFLAESHGKHITEPDLNIFAIPPFIISRHCSLLNKSESTKQIQEIVRQKTEPLLGLSRVLLSRTFGDSDASEKFRSIFMETLKKYCKNDHPFWGENTEEWMAAVKPCFQDNIYKNIISDQGRLNSSLNAACNATSNALDEFDDVMWGGGATDPEHLNQYNVYSPVYIYRSCYIRKGINSTDQIIETVYEKLRPLWELEKAMHTMVGHGSNLTLTNPKIVSFLSSLQKYCVKYVGSLRSDLEAVLKATNPCYEERENDLTMNFNTKGWTVEYACQHQDQVEEFLRTDGLECARKMNNDNFGCANVTPRHLNNSCETIDFYWKMSECAIKSLQNCKNSAGAEFLDYIHQQVSKMLPCNMTLFP